MFSPAAGGSIAAPSERVGGNAGVPWSVSRTGALFRVPERAKCCPFFKYSENSAVGRPRLALQVGQGFRGRAGMVHLLLKFLVWAGDVGAEPTPAGPL